MEVRSREHKACWCQITQGKSIFYSNREGWVGLGSGSCIYLGVRIYGNPDLITFICSVKQRVKLMAITDT